MGTRELAELFGVSPRAVSEVLRRAHKRLVESALMT
jgi:predicted DNA binding protein